MQTHDDTRPVSALRSAPFFDTDTGRHVGVVLTSGPPRRGASLRFLAPRPDLDKAVEPPLGWHWFESEGEVVCELAPTDENVLAQVAEDLADGDVSDYRLWDDTARVDRLRTVAKHHMAQPAEDASWQCERLLRLYEGYLRRVGEEADAT